MGEMAKKYVLIIENFTKRNKFTKVLLFKKIAESW